MNMVPYYKYILVMPNGNAKGFNDLCLAKACINMYYENQIKDYIKIDNGPNITESDLQGRINICNQVGVEEGECRVYDLLDFIEKIRSELVFDDEKEEVISKLLNEDINLNIYDYSIDNILNDVEIIQMIEPYGEL